MRTNHSVKGVKKDNLVYFQISDALDVHMCSLCSRMEDAIHRSFSQKKFAFKKLSKTQNQKI